MLKYQIKQANLTKAKNIRRRIFSGQNTYFMLPQWKRHTTGKFNPPTHPKRQFDVLRGNMKMDVAPYAKIQKYKMKLVYLPHLAVDNIGFLQLLLFGFVQS